MASWTVRIFSASSSGISISKASSNAITSSTVSSESAPRSSTKEALGVTSPSSTPSCSTMICFTFSSTAAMLLLAQMDWGLLGQREILTAGGSCGQTAGQTQSCRTGPRARDIVWLSKLRIDGARGFYLSTIDRNPWLQPRMLVSDQSPKLSFAGGDWLFGERGIVPLAILVFWYRIRALTAHNSRSMPLASATSFAFMSRSFSALRLNSSSRMMSSEEFMAGGHLHIVRCRKKQEKMPAGIAGRKHQQCSPQGLDAFSRDQWHH